jgi:predicted GIY-YIG superfamily endonuclease
MQGASIYILRCADGSYYTGITRRSVEERVSEHAQCLIKRLLYREPLADKTCFQRILRAR